MTVTDTSSSDTTTTPNADRPASGAVQKPKAPRSRGSAAAAGMWIATALLVIGIVTLREGLIAADAIRGDYWIAAFANEVDGQRPSALIAGIGFGSLVIGLLLLLSAVRPRRRVRHQLQTQSGVYLGYGSTGELVEQAVKNVDGVLSVESGVTRRKVRVRARVTGNDRVVASEVRAAAIAVLEPLATKPDVKVTIDRKGGAV